MAEAYKSANTQVWVGNDGTQVSPVPQPYLVPLAAGEERYIRSADLSGTTAIDKVPTFGGEDVEAIVNQQGVDVSTNLLYGDGPKSLTVRQDLKNNKLAIVFTDSLSGYVLPVTWTGQPYENPTSSLITVAMEFLSNGVATDAGQVAGKTRAYQFTDKPAGDESPAVLNISEDDKVWAVITDHAGVVKKMSITKPSGAAQTDEVPCNGEGIYELPVSGTFSDQMMFRYEAGTPASDLISGWLIIGPDMTIDEGA